MEVTEKTMSLATLTLEVGRRSEAKTRVFSVRLLGYLLADGLWERTGSGSVLQPAWIAYLGTDQESRAFTANFRAGPQGEGLGRRLRAAEALAAPLDGGAGAGRRHHGRLPAGAVPPRAGEADGRGRSPSSSRRRGGGSRSRPRLLAGEFGDDAEDAARAALFAAYLDRRSHLPLVHDLRFHLQLYRAALRTPTWLQGPSASRWGGRVCWYAHGAATAGLDLPLACIRPREARPSGRPGLLGEAAFPGIEDPPGEEAG